MKKVAYHLLMALVLLAGSSCSKFDNYDEPKETICGQVFDKETGKPLQTEVGEGGVRVKLMEYSWSENPTPYYLSSMQNGDFNNTKIFAGEYGISVMGAFVPVPEERHNVKGKLDLRFDVEPFLRVEWIEQPVVNADKTLTAKIKISRGTNNPGYQQNISHVGLFIVANAPYVGENNYDDRFTVITEKEAANNMLGQTVTLTSKAPLLTGRTYHVRVGARMDKEIEGRRRYNYTEMVTLEL